MKKIILLVLILSTLSVNFPCSHTPRCKTFHEHKNKIKKLPGNGIQKTIYKKLSIEFL